MRLLMAGITAIILLLPMEAMAQTSDSRGNLNVNVQALTPSGVTTAMTGGSVVTQNIFQSVLASSASRKGAVIQNTSAADALYVFFGANASATKATSFQITAGQYLNAATLTGEVLTDNISVTCADATPANCTFVVGAQ